MAMQRSTTRLDRSGQQQQQRGQGGQGQGGQGQGGQGQGGQGQGQDLGDQVLTQLEKTTLCNFFAAGHCPAGTSCRFAHGNHELRSQPNFWKTSICKDWKNGNCPHTAAMCSRAHGYSEVRTTDQEGDARRRRTAFWKRVNRRSGFVNTRRFSNSSLTASTAAPFRGQQPAGNDVGPATSTRAVEKMYVSEFSDDDDDDDSMPKASQFQWCDMDDVPDPPQTPRSKPSSSCSSAMSSPKTEGPQPPAVVSRGGSGGVDVSQGLRYHGGALGNLSAAESQDVGASTNGQAPQQMRILNVDGTSSQRARDAPAQQKHIQSPGSSLHGTAPQMPAGGMPPYYPCMNPPVQPGVVVMMPFIYYTPTVPHQTVAQDQGAEPQAFKEAAGDSPCWER
eukprot:TRINITY_DN91175_c0_g1_i1.p1 TRINITY_DN91175_c0_g1~~TRINITY_DN91175_c0_g1_i1.p1  ORF type:complete len:391 (-),score=73.22 TRINITY_DN91175_c0_g1_i1:251-1423(-)